MEGGGIEKFSMHLRQIWQGAGAGLGSGAMRIAIYGAGGFARELSGFAHRLLDRQNEARTEAIVFVSDVSHEIGAVVDGVRVISFDDLTRPSNRDREIVIAISDHRARREIAARCQANDLTIRPVFSAPTHVCYLDRRNIGEGAIFSDFTIVTAPGVKIGRHFHCNIYSYVAHDCVIGDFVTLAPKVCCNGNVIIEDDAYIGTGAVIKQGSKKTPIVIGKGALVGMGAVVTKNVPPESVVVGNPAKPLVRGPS
jgi:sugar O-acyltransferase (sialic acid O-acetyltransferase NeuD family)